MKKPKDGTRNNYLVIITAVIVIGGMAGFGYQFYEHNSRVAQEISSIDVPDDEISSERWIKNDGSNSCPLLAEQRFDSNNSHYTCIYQR